jgi:hypothetical protein
MMSFEQGCFDLVRSYRSGAHPLALWRMIREISRRAEQENVDIAGSANHVEYSEPPVVGRPTPQINQL